MMLWSFLWRATVDSCLLPSLQGHCWLVRREQGRRQHAAMEEEEPAALQPAVWGSEAAGDARDGAPQPGQPLAGKHWDPSPTLPSTSPPQSAALWHTEGRPSSHWVGLRRQTGKSSPIGLTQLSAGFLCTSLTLVHFFYPFHTFVVWPPHRLMQEKLFKIVIMLIISHIIYIIRSVGILSMYYTFLSAYNYYRIKECAQTVGNS